MYSQRFAEIVHVSITVCFLIPLKYLLGTSINVKYTGYGIRVEPFIDILYQLVVQAHFYHE